jgi:bacterioferritin-associated ferredoxin
MYVCICKAVTDKRIARSVSEGVTTLKDLRDRTGLGTNCGKCVPQAYQLLRDTLERRHSPAAHHEVMVREG